jgi:hypothetical protein
MKALIIRIVLIALVFSLLYLSWDLYRLAEKNVDTSQLIANMVLVIFGIIACGLLLPLILNQSEAKKQKAMLRAGEKLLMEELIAKMQSSLSISESFYSEKEFSKMVQTVKASRILFLAGKLKDMMSGQEFEEAVANSVKALRYFDEGIEGTERMVEICQYISSRERKKYLRQIFKAKKRYAQLIVVSKKYVGYTFN